MANEPEPQTIGVDQVAQDSDAYWERVASGSELPPEGFVGESDKAGEGEEEG